MEPKFKFSQDEVVAVKPFFAGCPCIGIIKGIAFHYPGCWETIYILQTIDNKPLSESNPFTSFCAGEQYLFKANRE